MKEATKLIVRTCRHWRSVVGSALLTVGFSTGCASGDPEADSGGGTGQPPELDGVRVQCCYELFVLLPDSMMDDIGCTAPGSFSPCVDPNDPSVDTDLNGMLSPPELLNMCAGKCPSPLDFPFNGVPFVDPITGLGIDLVPPFNGCIAIGGSIDPSGATCDPSSPHHLEPWPNSSVPPTNEGTFSSGTPGNQADVTVNGVTVAVDYDGDFAFAVSDCTTIRNQELCYFELQHLELALVGTPTFGGYEVDGAVLDLSKPSTTTVTFTCDASGCFGTFDFSARTGTILGINFNWDQTTTSTGTIGGGGLALGENGLGSIARVVGELDVDISKTAGTLRLWGEGSDSFGGDFAAATFDLTGPVSRFEL